MGLRDFFVWTLYLRIWPERLVLRDVRNGRQIDDVAALAIDESSSKARITAVGAEAVSQHRADPRLKLVYPFRHARVPLADFTAGEKLLQHLFRRAYKEAAVPPMVTRVAVQPMHALEGGLVQIERRAFLELVQNAGAAQAGVHEGPELLDHQIDNEFFRKAMERLSP